jgi:hypothetical protein
MSHVKDEEGKAVRMIGWLCGVCEKANVHERF